MKLIKLTYKQFKDLRKKQWLKQDRMCAILRQPISYEDASFDHKHRRKDESVGEDGKGLLRGVLEKRANVFEGKVANLYKRLGLHNFISLPDLLISTGLYIKYPPMEPKYVHPKEREFKKLKKSEYNRICKYYFKMYPKRKKLPKFPKSGKMTKRFEDMLKEANKLYTRDKK